MNRHDLDVLNKRNRMTAEERRADIYAETFGTHFPAIFGPQSDQDAELPWDGMDNVADDDKPWPTEVGFDGIPMPQTPEAA